MPFQLTKGMTPLEVSGWLKKFEQWFQLSHGNGADDHVKSTEIQMNLDLEWSNHLKGIIQWDEASYTTITGAIFAELLIQDPKLTRQASLFGLSMDKVETLCDFITRMERGSTVCYLSDGLKKRGYCCALHSLGHSS